MLISKVDGEWWTISGNPDLGNYTNGEQVPVDFGIWQAADGMWQLWSCINHTKCSGDTRLFYRWQSETIENVDWQPMGIAMMAVSVYGERAGGLQSPYVIKHNDKYYMFYGTWDYISLAMSDDGKTFERHQDEDGYSRVVAEKNASNIRDPMVLKVQDTFYMYYTAVIADKAAIYCRTSSALHQWGPSTIVSSGGVPGNGSSSADSPFVLHKDGLYFLYRTHLAGGSEKFMVSLYVSPDPLNFGVNNRDKFLCSFPFEAPEIVHHRGQHYIATMLPGLDGTRVARLKFDHVS